MAISVETTTEIRPFSVAVPKEALDDLRRRIEATQWPEQETVADDSQGVPLATMRKLARHWATEYDWRRVEAKLNSLPQFITEIDGLGIHFIHVRSKHDDALPLIVNHGWRLDHRAAEDHRSTDRSPRPTAGAHRTRSTWWSRRCRATSSPASPQAPAGAPSAWAAPGTY